MATRVQPPKLVGSGNAMLRTGVYCDGKVKVLDHAVGSVLIVGKERFLVNGAGAVFPYEETATKRTETVVGGTKVPKPPKV